MRWGGPRATVALRGHGVGLGRRVHAADPGIQIKPAHQPYLLRLVVTPKRLVLVDEVEQRAGGQVKKLRAAWIRAPCRPMRPRAPRTASLVDVLPVMLPARPRDASASALVRD